MIWIKLVFIRNLILTPDNSPWAAFLIDSIFIWTITLQCFLKFKDIPRDFNFKAVHNSKTASITFFMPCQFRFLFLDRLKILRRAHKNVLCSNQEAVVEKEMRRKTSFKFLYDNFAIKKREKCNVRNLKHIFLCYVSLTSALWMLFRQIKILQQFFFLKPL
jgi:hypothetical protein